MASKFFDRVKAAVSGTPGTGAITIGAAVSGFAPWSGVSDGAVVSYLIEDGTSFEFGRGTYAASGPTLSRTTIIASSNSGSAINVSMNAQLSVTFLSEDIADIYTAIAAAAEGGSGGTGGGGGSSGTPPTVVQVQSFSTQGGVSGSGTETLTTAPTVGNLLVAIALSPGSLATVGSGWTLVSSHSNTNMNTATAVRKVVAGDTATVSPFPNIGPGSSGAITIWEVNGWNSSDLITPFQVYAISDNTVGITTTVTGIPTDALFIGQLFTTHQNPGIAASSTNATIVNDPGLLGYLNDYYAAGPFHSEAPPSAMNLTGTATNSPNYPYSQYNWVLIGIAFIPPSSTTGEVPAGGTTGQVLTKASGTDYDTEWATPAAGSGSALTLPVSAHLSNNLSLAQDSGFHIVPFDTADLNGGGHYDTSSGIYTCPVSGMYLMVANIRLADSGPTNQQFGMGVSTTATISNSNPDGFTWYTTGSAQRTAFSYSRLFYFDAGTTIAFNYNTINTNFTMNAGQSSLSIAPVVS